MQQARGRTFVQVTPCVLWVAQGSGIRVPGTLLHMSWDIFIQQLPAAISSVRDIPDDFEPDPLGTRAEVIARIRSHRREFAPDADGFALVETEHGSIEIDIGAADHVQSVMLSARGGSDVVPVVSAIVGAFGGRALDPSSETGLFDETAAARSFATWKGYRDTALAEPAPKPRPWWRRLLGG